MALLVALAADLALVPNGLGPLDLRVVVGDAFGHEWRMEFDQLVLLAAAHQSTRSRLKTSSSSGLELSPEVVF
jgi:hypothetical protein